MCFDYSNISFHFEHFFFHYFTLVLVRSLVSEYYICGFFFLDIKILLRSPTYFLWFLVCISVLWLLSGLTFLLYFVLNLSFIDFLDLAFIDFLLWKHTIFLVFPLVFLHVYIPSILILLLRLILLLFLCLILLLFYYAFY